MNLIQAYKIAMTSEDGARITRQSVGMGRRSIEVTGNFAEDIYEQDQYYTNDFLKNDWEVIPF